VGGVIIWHDYGILGRSDEGLEELEQQAHLGICNIREQVLSFGRKNEDPTE
jgi:hypothetical protein